MQLCVSWERGTGGTMEKYFKESRQENQQEKQTVIRFVKDILHNIYGGGTVENLNDVFAEDIVWTGEGRDQKVQGKAAVTDWLRIEQMAARSWHMDNEDVWCRQLSEDCFQCEICMDLHGQDYCGEPWTDSHRCSMIVRKIEDAFQLIYIHSSMIYAGKEDMYETRQALARAQKETRQVTQRFIHAVSGLYEAIYEVDLLAGTIHVWKESGQTVSVPGKFDSLTRYFNIVGEGYVHPEYRQAFREWVNMDDIRADFRSGREERSIEVPKLCMDGEYRWFQIQLQAIQVTDGAMLAMIYVKNVDEQKKEEIRRQLASLEALQLMKGISSAYDMLISVNLTKNTYYMIGYERFLNHSADEDGCFDDLIEVGASTVPEPYRAQFTEAFCRENLLKAYHEGKSSVYLEHLQVGDDGKNHWISTHVMFTENPYNDDVMEVTLSRCIDDLREKEAENRKVLQDALYLAEQANSAKTDFLSRMSHDIRTPLNAIIGMTVIAGAHIHEPEKLQDCLMKIDSSSRYLLSLINDILDLSRIESGKMSIAMEPFDFREMIKGISRIIGTQAAEKNQQFSVTSGDALERMYIGDELRLRQILMNLLNNAHKYTQEGGSISLDISGKAETLERTAVTFTVRDNGMGITPEFLEKIFDAFSQDINANGSTGSGLGLAITQNLVHMMNGSITVQSEPGKGSCFTVEVPLRRVQQHADRIKAPSSDLRILVVDDESVILEEVSVLLGDMGLQAVLASDGYEALERLKEHKAAATPFDVVIVDWKMPEMDGVETVRRMREIAGNDLMMVVMSAYDWSEIEKEARTAGIDLFLSKPINESNLRAVLAGAGGQEEPEEEAVFDGECILLAEDNELNQEIACAILEMKNLVVDVACNGKEAVEKFAAAKPGQYAMILMDIQMPEMNGYEAARKIRALDSQEARTIPIYAMTANAFSSDVAEALASGMNGHIAKPLELDKLESILLKELR